MQPDAAQACGYSTILYYTDIHRAALPCKCAEKLTVGACAWRDWRLRYTVQCSTILNIIPTLLRRYVRDSVQLILTSLGGGAYPLLVGLSHPGKRANQ